MLRDASEAAEGDPVLDDDVAGELNGVGDHAVRADDDVVRDVAPAMKRLLRADASSTRRRSSTLTVTCSRNTLSSPISSRVAIRRRLGSERRGPFFGSAARRR